MLSILQYFCELQNESNCINDIFELKCENQLVDQEKEKRRETWSRSAVMIFGFHPENRYYTPHIEIGFLISSL
jgi:hypothetical protein